MTTELRFRLDNGNSTDNPRFPATQRVGACLPRLRAASSASLTVPMQISAPRWAKASEDGLRLRVKHPA